MPGKDQQRERLRLLLVGVQWPPQSFLRRLFDGLAETFDLLVASRSPLDDTAFERVVLPPERWPRVLRAARATLSAASALGHAPGRRLAKRRYWRWLPYLQKEVDAIYFPWNYGATSNLPLMRLGIPSIISCRGAQVQVGPHQPERREQTARLAESLALATRVHCVSRAILDSAVEFGLDAAKARVIRPAVDPSFFRPAVRPSAPPFRLVAAGSLIWRKGFEDTLLALRGLLDRGFDVRLELAGDGRDRQRLLFAVHDLGLEDRVTLHGRISAGEVLELLQRAHVFVLSSFSEGIANVALEAMACGVPVVSTRCGGMAEAITDGACGLLVPVHEPAAIEEAVARLLGDEVLRRRLGEAARRRIEADFRLEDQVAAFRDLIFEVSPRRLI